jgi:hypothetical protein
MKNYEVTVKYDFFGQTIQDVWQWKASSIEQLQTMLNNARQDGIEIINYTEVA